MENNTPILLVDDDKELCELLTEFLSHDGFQVQYCQSGHEALDYLSSTTTPPSVAVLDIMMPQMNGLELLQAIRAQYDLPIIMLTGRGDDIDRILGLEMGADDYMAKPCNPRELVARLRAVLRRTQSLSSQANPPSVISMHRVTLDSTQRLVSVQGKNLSLTSAEFSALHVLMQQAGQVVSKETLTEQVLHRKLTAYDRSIDVHVSRVRQKLSKLLGGENLIQTVRGVGYQFSEKSG